jgi:predicted nucleic acid-binding protein
MYLDSAYVAKFYVNEPDSTRVRNLIQNGNSFVTSAWALCEVQSVFHRHLREGYISKTECQEFARIFLEHVAEGLWELLPVTKPLLQLAGSLSLAAPPDIFLRAGDALHLATAREAGSGEIWTNDRRMLAAAPYFGITGRSV